MRLVQHTALGILHNTTGPSPNRHHDISNLDTPNTMHTHHTHTHHHQTDRPNTRDGWSMTFCTTGASTLVLGTNGVQTRSGGTQQQQQQQQGRGAGDKKAIGWTGLGFGFGSIYMGVLGGGWVLFRALAWANKACLEIPRRRRTGIMYIECGMGIPPLALAGRCIRF